MEDLGRGVVAIRTNATDVYVGWRLLGTDPQDVALNPYRSTGGGAPIVLNATPIVDATNFVDTTADISQPNAYRAQAIIGGFEQEASGAFTLPAEAPTNQYLSIALVPPPGGVTPAGETYTYSANDASVGDLDGDGEYEIALKWDPSNSKDNANDGYTGNVFLDAYKLNGARLWRIDLGRNIRAGAHYTQFMVYDLDSDGRAELAMKTADGAGTVIGDPNADYRTATGRILYGPEAGASTRSLSRVSTGTGTLLWRRRRSRCPRPGHRTGTVGIVTDGLRSCRWTKPIVAAGPGRRPAGA
jgi:rhamnogalacturonan endolyase